jgi:hypothetical protein
MQRLLGLAAATALTLSATLAHAESITGVAVNSCETPRCGFMPQLGAARAAPL